MVVLGERTLSSPKVSSAERSDSLFPYYAGFSEAFVRDVVGLLDIGPGTVVLDPWNGSGTTTAVTSAAGAHSIGIDVNPVLGVVARARLASVKDAETALSVLGGRSRRFSADSLRGLCGSSGGNRAEALLLLAIFRLARQKLRHADLIGTNPTWWNLQASHANRLLGSLTHSQVQGELEWLSTKVRRNEQRRARVVLTTGDLLGHRPGKRLANAIVTSPPYLTRIDYVKATLPELFILSALKQIDVEQLRRTMIGASVVGKGPEAVPLAIGPYARSILAQIASHRSKASPTYYLAFFTSYIAKMYRAFEVIAQMAAPGARMVMVVQGSHYKEVYIDLGRLISELGQPFGFSLCGRVDFRFSQSFAQFNPRAKGYANETAHESVLFFDPLNKAFDC